MLADEYFRAKESVPAELRTAEWERAGQWVKERAFFSAAVTETEILDEFRQWAQKVVEGSTDESTARVQLQLFLDRVGYKPEAGQEGTIKDLRSLRRLTVMLRTNRQLAQGYAEKVRGFGPGAIRLYPAWELVRLGPVPQVPRDWRARWLKVGGTLTPDGRMIALKQDLIWAELGSREAFEDALNVDYPPFAWQSGMGWMPVKFQEVKALGMLEGWRPPETKPLASPNESLEVKPRIQSGVLRHALAEKLQGLAEWRGDTLVFTDPNGTRKLTQQEAAKVITAKLPDGFADNHQARAAKLWLENAAKHIKFKKGRDILDDFSRLLERIEPLPADQPVYRGEYYASEADLQNRIDQLKATYQVSTMGDSFSVLESIAKKFAANKTPYELIIVCKKHSTFRPIYAIAKKVMPKYAKQGEAIAKNGMKLRAIGEPLVTIDTRGKRQVYLEVEEVL